VLLVETRKAKMWLEARAAPDPLVTWLFKTDSQPRSLLSLDTRLSMLGGLKDQEELVLFSSERNLYRWPLKTAHMRGFEKSVFIHWFRVRVV